MFNPIEDGRRIREERQRGGCGFCGLADKREQFKPYQHTCDHAQVTDGMRTITDTTPLEKIRKSPADHPQTSTLTNTKLSANPQNPQQIKPSDKLATKATSEEVEIILTGIVAAGRDLKSIKPLARWTMQALDLTAAAELAVAIDDAFEKAADDVAARAQCQLLLDDPGLYAKGGLRGHGGRQVHHGILGSQASGREGR